MGLWSRLIAPWRKRDSEGAWINGAPWSAHSATGVDVNQTTAITATTVLACVTMLCEDFAKLTPTLYSLDSDKKRVEATGHELYPLLIRPNEWQNWFEFSEMMQFSLVLRGNAYAVKIRDGRGRVRKLVPVNADWVALWESPDGKLFYRVTPNGLHLRAELINEPFLIPYEDVFHVRGFTMNGLTGGSRIALAKDAIGLAIAYERQGAQWMGQGASVSGILTTPNRLTPDGAERMAQSWKDSKSGLQNAGKIAIFEQGLKYEPIAMTAQALDFINSRNFQIQEITRLFRIPAHMIGDLQRVGNGANLAQLAQEYVNLTITGYTKRWAAKLDDNWDLRKDGVYIDFDVSALTYGDTTQRYNNYARGISGGFLKPNEARIDDKRDPVEGGDKIYRAATLVDADSPTAAGGSEAGSQSTASGAEGGGRPPDGSADKSVLSSEGQA